LSDQIRFADLLAFTRISDDTSLDQSSYISCPNIHSSNAPNQDDNFFASLLAELDNRDIAYSNFFQSGQIENNSRVHSYLEYAKAQVTGSSGLDNSHMYDDDIFDVHTHTMNMSDVGVSSLVCQEAFSLSSLVCQEAVSLATLADAIWRESAATLCSVLFLLIFGTTTDKSLPADIT
jgi:hypothetical protein